jgi:hypothetical protein
MRKFRFPLLFLLIGCILAMGILIYIPESSFRLKISILFLTFLVWLATVILVWNKRPMRYAILTATAAVLAFLVLPGRNYDTVAIRDAYCKAMFDYEGTHYEWGGENGRGIDCSGLVRRGLINADIWMGVKTLNPRLARAGLALWWYDCSARALLQEYRGWTSPLFEKQSINAIIEREICAGDIAVTANGVHVLAYLGNNQWIEADPMAKKVLVVNVPCKNNGWFNTPIKIMRWRQLAF